MADKNLTKGWLVLAVALLISSLSDFLESWGVLAARPDFVRGLLDGAAVVALAAAIWLMARSRRR
jgi:hypothetical protein